MNHLCLPFELDALVLEQGRMVSKPYSFERMPYFDGKKDRNSDTPNLGESVVNQAFSDKMLYLDKGLHLHFILPSVFLQASLDEQTTPQQKTMAGIATPNRWWVVKEASDGSLLKTWLVESDYLHAPDSDNKKSANNSNKPPRAVALPITYPKQEPNSEQKNATPFCYMGRQISLEQSQQPTGDEKYLTDINSDETLNAFILGELEYSLYYPNCYSIFGFHDADFDLSKDKHCRYRVLGTYGDNYTAAKQQQVITQIYKTINKDEIKNIKAENDVTSSVYCYSSIRFDEQASTGQKYPDLDVELAMGLDETEAQIAFLSKVIEHASSDTNTASKTLEKTQDRLQAAEFVERLDLKSHDRVIDLKRIIQELRFETIATTYQYQIALKQADSTTAAMFKGSASSKKATHLPIKLQQDLSELNFNLYQYTQKKFQLESFQQQLFTDWTQYMKALYPSVFKQQSLVSVNEIKDYLDAIKPEIIAFKKDVDESLAKIKKSVEALTSELNTLNSKQDHNTDKKQYELISVPSNNYHRPKNPSLVIGEKVKGSLYADNNIQLPAPSHTDLMPLVNNKHFDKQHWTNFIQSMHDHKLFSAIKTWKNQPFKPIKLAWELHFEAEPTAKERYQLNETFPLKFMDKGYQLEDYDTPRPKFKALFRREPQKETGYYRGYSPLQIASLTGLQNKIADLAQAPKAYNVKDLVAILTAIETKIADKRSLYASIAGFNAACLMQTDTLQLTIADPLNFKPYQDFTDELEKLIGSNIGNTPQNHFPFNPFREGELAVKRLSLISSFGISRELHWQANDNQGNGNSVAILEETKGGNNTLALTPKLLDGIYVNVKPIPHHINQHVNKLTSAHFSAENDKDSTPIFGFISLDSLSKAIVVYNKNAQAVGKINNKRQWIPFNNSDEQGGTAILENSHLKKWVEFITTSELKRYQVGNQYQALKQYISLYYQQRAHENNNENDFLRQGKPLALMRFSIGIEMKGFHSIHQGWRYFAEDVITKNSYQKRLKNGYSAMPFEIGLGNEMAQQEGLVAILTEQANEQGDYHYHQGLKFVKTQDIFNHTTQQTKKKPHNQILGTETKIALTPTGEYKTFTCIFDPTCPITIQPGITPDVQISLDETIYQGLLKRLQPIYFSPYLLTPKHQRSVPLPEYADAAWSLLEPSNNGFKREIFEHATIGSNLLETAINDESIKLTQDDITTLVNAGYLQPIVRRVVFSQANRKKLISEHLCASDILEALSQWRYVVLHTQQEKLHSLATIYGTEHGNTQALIEECNKLIKPENWVSYRLIKPEKNTDDNIQQLISVVEKLAQNLSVTGEALGDNHSLEIQDTYLALHFINEEH